MKYLNYLNYFFVGLPIVLGLIGLYQNSLFVHALLSTMLTGGFQVIVGIIMIVKNPKSKWLHMYFAAVILFFILWAVGVPIDYIMIIPPILALYFSVILYKTIANQYHTTI